MTTDVLDRRFHGVAVYNPDLLSKDELIEQFVARQQLLDELLSDLRRPNFTQHQLLVGSRGMGKTTLLRRLRFAVDDDPELSAQWMPLTFPEEQYNVARLSDFYLNVIDALGDTLEQRGRREEAAALDGAIEQIPRGDETRRAEAALGVLLGAADRIGRRLLLLVDNLDLVLARLEKQNGADWAFREMLSHERRILLIGATPVFIGATFDYDAPFYDFFRVHELHGLSREETRAVLSRLAAQRGEAEVERLVREDTARIDTLHTLTGGNPRTIILLFNILAQGTEGDVRTDLEKLLDHCTPLYKARFDALAPQQQNVVDAVAIHWDPISAGDLAATLGLEVNTVSAQLTRLVQQGVLEKVDYHPASKTGFQLAERFFNVWYLMRASRRVRRRMLWLVHFLKLFYGAERLIAKAQQLLSAVAGKDRTSRLRDAELCLAVAQVISDDWQTRSALESRAIRLLITDDQLRNQLGMMLDLDGVDAELTGLVSRERWLITFETELADLKLPEKRRTELADLIGSSTVLTRAQKLQLVRTFNRGDRKERERVTRVLKHHRKRLATFLGMKLSGAICRAFREGYLDTTTDEVGAKSAARALAAPEVVGFCALAADHSLIEQHIELVKELSALNQPFFMLVYSQVMLRRGEVRQAIALYERAQTLEQSGFADFVGGCALASGGRFEAATFMLERYLEGFPADADAWHELAKVFFDRGQTSKAIDAFEQAMSLGRRSAIVVDFARVLIASGDPTKAERLLCELLDADPTHESGATLLANVYELQGRKSEALEVLRCVNGIESSIARAGVLASMERDGDAVAVLATLVANRSLDVPQAAAVVRLYSHLGRVDEVLGLLRRDLGRYVAMEGYEAIVNIVDIAGTALRHGYATALRELISEVDQGDALRPLHEALTIAEDGDHSKIARLAPELRHVVAGLLKVLVPVKRAEAAGSRRRRSRTSVGKKRVPT